MWLMLLLLLLDTSPRPQDGWSGTWPVEILRQSDAKDEGEKNRYTIPTTFQKGALREITAKGAKELRVDAGTMRDYLRLLRRPYPTAKERILSRFKYVGPMIASLASDDEREAKRSFQMLHDLMKKLKVSASDPDEPLKNPVKLRYINSAYWRGGEYAFFTDWYSLNKGNLRIWLGEPEVVRKVHPKTFNWDRIMKNLRTGGAYDQPDRPEGAAFAKVKAAGKAAYPYLIKYLDNEDPMLGRAANAVLCELTDRKVVYRPAQKAALKKEWEKWVEKDAEKK